MQGHMLKRRLEPGTRGRRNAPQVGVQFGIGQVAVFALGTVRLEV